MRTSRLPKVLKQQQPESVIKGAIFTYLTMQPEFFGFSVSNTGIYDAKAGRFRCRNGVGMRKGVPDICGAWNGQFIGIEVKTPTGRLSPHQKLFHQDAIAKGCLIFVARGIEDAVDFVAALRVATKKQEKELQLLNDVAYPSGRGKHGHPRN